MKGFIPVRHLLGRRLPCMSHWPRQEPLSDSQFVNLNLDYHGFNMGYEFAASRPQNKVVHKKELIK